MNSINLANTVRTALKLDNLTCCHFQTVRHTDLRRHVFFFLIQCSLWESFSLNVIINLQPSSNAQILGAFLGHPVYPRKEIP